MLFGLCLGYDTAIVGPQASQVCWRLLNDAVRRYNTYEAVRTHWMRMLELDTLSIVRVAVDPSQGSLGARPDGYCGPGAKTLSRSFASVLQDASLLWCAHVPRLIAGKSDATRLWNHPKGLNDHLPVRQ